MKLMGRSGTDMDSSRFRDYTTQIGKLAEERMEKLSRCAYGRTWRMKYLNILSRLKSLKKEVEQTRKVSRALNGNLGFYGGANLCIAELQLDISQFRVYLQWLKWLSDKGFISIFE